jgi:hypothetical protein
MRLPARTRLSNRDGDRLVETDSELSASDREGQHDSY